jgi:neutral ceramidase
MIGTRTRWPFAVATLLWGLLAVEASASDSTGFRAGAAVQEITPPVGIPMWGYGARHDKPSEGTLDPLMAQAIVIAAGDEKVAIVGTDLGRGPTEVMMQLIRREIVDKAGIRHVLISGSHSHHGPVIELVDEPGLGKGKFDGAVAYSSKLPQLLVEVILAADKKLKPARVGFATESVTLNRNRQSKREPKATDPMLAVLRFDDQDGKPIAVLVNFAAHPVMTEEKLLKYSADYPGFLKNKVEAELATRCVFMQGAAGDMSPNPGKAPWAPRPFGELVAQRVIALARSIKTETPARPSVKGVVDTFHFKTRVDLKDPRVAGVFERSYFPEIVHTYVKLYGDSLTAELNTVLINGEIALVGGSGEFFCNHANRLKARSYVKLTLFCGYCNGHGMYFPTIEAASEGGYGADPGVSLAELGAAERMMDKALFNIYLLQGKFAREPHPEQRAQSNEP